MPVGVPKVAFLVYGDEDASWVDIYNRLYRQRLLFLCQEVKSEIANQIIGLMVYLSIEDSTRDQFLFINSPGGGLIPGVGVYDALGFVPADVHTLGLGVVASMGCFILLGGTVTKRLAYPHARVMMHQPASTFFESPLDDLLLDSYELNFLRDAVAMAYVERSGKPRWVVEKDLERDVFMTPTEALAYGIIDFIGVD
uniref:ATP-dependent Clp protease proteolytic subunit n=1 Tax=Syringa reticulata subsp. amurensis TaxID=149021 RepID=A0A8A0WQX6_9LAMI|nr:ATP-dependent Clp protease proteolytic subunit [Syringa reticulata subsp. amurensis]